MHIQEGMGGSEYGTAANEVIAWQRRRIKSETGNDYHWLIVLAYIERVKSLKLSIITPHLEWMYQHVQDPC